MSKKTVISIRLDEKEREYLATIAKQNGLALSEYIRLRVLEKERAGESCSYKKDMATFSILSYYLIGKIAKKQLTESEIIEAKDRTEKLLAEYNLTGA
jgi:hypothetical protein